MDIQSAFVAFYKAIKLKKAERDDAKIKYNGVCGKLHSHFYPDTAYDGKTRFLFGSYGKKTHIRPARDIDVIFIMPPEKFAQYDDNDSNCQSQLLQDIRSVLQKKYPKTPIKAFEKVVVLEFSDPRHNVEVLPAWENSDGTFTIPNASNGGAWESFDPRSEICAIKDSHAVTGVTKSVIRMVKKWTESCSVKVKSYLIEQEVLRFFISNTHDGHYSSTLVNFFSFFHDSTTDESLKSHLNTALKRAQKAIAFEDEEKLEEASVEWRKIFGTEFPSVQVEKSLTAHFRNLISDLQDLFPSETEEYLDTKYGISTILNPIYSVGIDVNINQNGWRHNHWLLSEFQARGYRIQKNASLLFKITSNNVPQPYSVKWKVRNYGEEAKDLGILRGEISDDDGSETKTESTRYHGEHYVECYIIKDGVCVATAQVFVPII